MSNKSILLLALLCLGATVLAAADFPTAHIKNGKIEATLYLPDSEKGYYRATRFDWAGIISSLTFAGHEYFGQWFDHYDPKLNDAIMGPVEEFRTGETSLGYDEAKVGGTFLRIGVGVVRKPAEATYRQFGTYDIVDPGKWTIQKGTNWIRFTQDVRGDNGYAYQYVKTIRLTGNKPEMVIDHALKNRGRRVIDSTEYDHNFFMIDHLPIGPDVVFRYFFAPKATDDLKGLAQVNGNEITFPHELQTGQSFHTFLQGFGTSPRDYGFQLENRKASAGVKVTGDTPLSNLALWSIRTTACTEPYVHTRVEPGKSVRWKYVYQFYTIP